MTTKQQRPQKAGKKTARKPAGLRAQDTAPEDVAIRPKPAKTAPAATKPKRTRATAPQAPTAATPPDNPALPTPGPETRATAPRPLLDVAASSQPLGHEQLLNALPHPVLVVAEDNTFVYANVAAEAFFSTSVAMLRRVRIDDVIAFGCPLLSLIEQIRRDHATVNEYGIEIITPRFTGPKMVDVYAGPFPDRPGHIVLMLQQRSMAQMIERQLTHRAAARSVSGMAGILAHEIKNPLSGIRGAAQLLEVNLSDEDRILSQLICTETDRIRALLDRMEVFGDERPLKKEPVNIHDVLDHVRQLAMAGFARNIAIVADYDPSLPAVPANRDKLVQAFLNLVKNAAEAIGARRRQRSHRHHHGLPPRCPHFGARFRHPRFAALDDRDPGQRPRRTRRNPRAHVRSLRDLQDERDRPRTGTRRQAHRRPRRHDRMRQRTPENDLPDTSADAGGPGPARIQNVSAPE